jgi:RimJ/RimL family protein N-acetyltransferase
MLKGQNIILRPLEVEDIPLIVEWKNNKEIMNNLNTYTPVTLMQEEAMYSLEQENPGIYKFLIEVEEEPIGYCGLVNIEWKSRRAEIFIVIAEESFRGQGHGIDATKALINFAFKDFNLRRLFLTCFKNNTKAIKLYETLNFQHEGILRQHTCREGQYDDMVLMGLLKEEWQN